MVDSIVWPGSTSLEPSILSTRPLCFLPSTWISSSSCASSALVILCSGTSKEPSRSGPATSKSYTRTETLDLFSSTALLIAHLSGK